MTANLLYTTEEEDLRASVRALLTDTCPPEAVLEHCEEQPPVAPRLWQALAGDLGATSLHVPEELGGQGATMRELAVVAEELGRFVTPVPFLGSSVLATSVLLGSPHGSRREQVLGELASGTRTATLAVSLSACSGEAFPEAVRYGSSGLSGTVRTVADAVGADSLLVPAIGADGAQLHCVEATADGLAVTHATSFDLTRPVADISLDGVSGDVIASGAEARELLDNALHDGAGILASEQVGIAEWCVDTTVSYLKQRYQFGRPVGSYQALKHRLADLWRELVMARAAARYAADTLATGGQDRVVAAGMAQSLCAGVARAAAEECIQLHGGIGMTWEHPAHLYLKRAKADEIALGTPDRHRQLIAPLVELPPAS